MFVRTVSTYHFLRTEFRSIRAIIVEKAVSRDSTS